MMAIRQISVRFRDGNFYTHTFIAGDTITLGYPHDPLIAAFAVYEKARPIAIIEIRGEIPEFMIETINTEPQAVCSCPTACPLASLRNLSAEDADFAEDHIEALLERLVKIKLMKVTPARNTRELLRQLERTL